MLILQALVETVPSESAISPLEFCWCPIHHFVGAWHHDVEWGYPIFVKPVLTRSIGPTGFVALCCGKVPPTDRWNPPWIKTPLWSKKEGNKWFNTLPIDLFTCQQSKWKEKDGRLTSFTLVVLVASTLDIDVQALDARKVMQGTKTNILLPHYIVKNKQIYRWWMRHQ